MIYDTIVKQPPFVLIKQACLDRFVTYDGVKDAVQHHTGFERKVLIHS
jgi:competence protein ComK